MMSICKDIIMSMNLQTRYLSTRVFMTIAIISFLIILDIGVRVGNWQWFYL